MKNNLSFLTFFLMSAIFINCNEKDMGLPLSPETNRASFLPDPTTHASIKAKNSLIPIKGRIFICDTGDPGYKILTPKTPGMKNNDYQSIELNRYDLPDNDTTHLEIK